MLFLLFVFRSMIFHIPPYRISCSVRYIGKTDAFEFARRCMWCVRQVWSPQIGRALTYVFTFSAAFNFILRPYKYSPRIVYILARCHAVATIYSGLFNSYRPSIRFVEKCDTVTVVRGKCDIVVNLINF